MIYILRKSCAYYVLVYMYVCYVHEIDLMGWVFIVSTKEYTLEDFFDIIVFI